MKTTENEDNTRTAFTDTSDYFEGIKDNIAALRKFFTAMPKGGDVHNHLTGSAYAETYFELAAEKGIYVDMTTGKLYKEQPDGIEVIQLSKEMDDLHNHRMTLVDKWSIRNFQPYKYPLGPDEYFFGTFGLLSALTSIHDYNDEFSLYNLARLMHELKVRASRENVQYLEVIGIAPIIPKYCFLDANTYNNYDRILKENVKTGNQVKLIATLKEIIDLFEESEEAQKNAESYFKFVQKLENKSNSSAFKTHLFDIKKIKCRYQGYAVRGLEPLMVFAQLYVVYKACLKDEEGKLLTGCNIVAAENGEKAMMYYELHMIMFSQLHHKYKSVNVSLHAGELTLGLVRPEHLTYHVKKAIGYGAARRIGHGVCLPFERDSDGTFRGMKSQIIAVEINLTSNEFILGVKGTEHPIRLYHEARIPIIISTDDPGILRTSLTEQYVLAASRYGFSYDEIKKFVYNSIKYSFLPKAEITDTTNTLNELFKDFESTFEKKAFLPAEANSEENES